MEMKDRIAKIIKKEQLTSQQFAEIIEIQSSTISHILAGRNLPSFKIISNLLEKFPKVSPDWLIFGKGDMYREEDKPRAIDHFAVNNDMFTNVNQIDDISEDEVPDESVNVADEIANDDVNIVDNIHVNQNISSDNIVSVKSNSPEKIIIMYSDKTFEIFNSK